MIMMVIFMKTNALVVFLFFLYSAQSRSVYEPVIFLCDSGGNFIFESTADELEFHSLPLPNVRQPVAVGYDFDDDVVFWVNAEDGSLNRAKRNGSGYEILDAGHDVIDLTIHVPSKKIAWINVHRNLSGLFDYSSGLQGNTFAGNSFSTVAAHQNGNFYVIDNTPSSVDIHTLYNSFYPMATNVMTGLTSARSLSLDREGTRLFINDDQKGTIESFGPLGGDQVTLFRTERTLPVDIAWYRGIPLWTDSATRGVTFLHGHRGVSPASANILHFENPTGIHVYHGQSHSKRPEERCLADEVTCGDLCIPSAWQCDGLVDCLDQSDETNCDPVEESDSLMFLTDLSGGAIYVAHTNNLNFRQLPFLFVQKPVAVGYDVIAKEVYWTDVERKTLSAAQIDGSNQRIVVQGLGVPDGLFVDSDNETIFWTDTDFKTIESIQFDGSNQRVLINDVDMPRAIIIVPENRKLYWTDWGSTPKIEMSNRDGSGRQMILDTDIGWPNGITYDMGGNRLIWCDARLDKIESCDLDGGGRKVLLDITHGTFHPFGVIAYEGTVMWSDWVLKGVGVEEPANQTWPDLYSSVSIIAQPSGIHVVVDPCYAEPCTYGTCHPLGVSDYECDCMTGFTGEDCDTVDSCSPEPCTYGTCHPLGESDYECDCVTGFTGKDCDTVDPCSDQPCVYGACHPLGVSDYQCDCVTGFTGKDCDTVDPCSAEPCTYGTCHPLGVSDYECDCITGFTGKDCYTVDSCYAEPCTYGTCHPLSVFDYECDCVTGFTGKDCDTAITCALPIESEDSHIEDPKDVYTPGERIIITCNNDANGSTTWICNASSGSWDVTEDLKCPGPTMNHTGRTIGIASGVIILALLGLIAFCVFAYIKRRKQPQVNHGNSRERRERGPLPHAPQDHFYMEMDEPKDYYSGISNPNNIGHIYDTNLVHGKPEAQGYSCEDQPRYETTLRSITQ